MICRSSSIYMEYIDCLFYFYFILYRGNFMNTTKHALAHEKKTVRVRSFT